jgi:hypothetical protein
MTKQLGVTLGFDSGVILKRQAWIIVLVCL